MGENVESKAVYIRMPSELRARIEAHREGRPVTEVVEDLLSQGLDAGDSIERLRKRLEAAESELSQARTEKHMAELSLRFSQASIESFKAQNLDLQTRFNQLLEVTVASCNRCNSPATVRNLLEKKCAKECTPYGFDFLPEYRGEKGAWDVIRDIAAVSVPASV